MMMIDEYDFDDDEVTALWDGRLPMDRVLETLQGEIERHEQTHAQRAAAIARAEAAEQRVAELEVKLGHMPDSTNALSGRVDRIEIMADAYGPLTQGVDGHYISALAPRLKAHIQFGQFLQVSEYAYRGEIELEGEFEMINGKPAIRTRQQVYQVGDTVEWLLVMRRNNE